MEGNLCEGGNSNLHARGNAMPTQLPTCKEKCR